MEYVLIRFVAKGDDFDAYVELRGSKAQCENLLAAWPDVLGQSLKVMTEAEWRFVFRSRAEAIA